MKNNDYILNLPEPNYFGDCPECGRSDGYLNIERDHYFVCHAHKKKWFVGGNLFSDWRTEDETIWLFNNRRLQDYQEVEPWHRDPLAVKPQKVSGSLIEFERG